MSKLNHILDTVEAAGVGGWTGWEYWDMYNNGTLVMPAATALSRTYAPVVAGTGVTSAFDAATASYTLTYLANTNATAPTAVFLCQDLHYPAGFDVSVAGPATWYIEWHNASAPAAAAERAGDPTPPPPFSFAYLVVTNTGGAAQMVTVTVTAR